VPKFLFQKVVVVIAQADSRTICRHWGDIFARLNTYATL